MMRLHVFCEGQTEEAFVAELLVPHFAPHKVSVIPLILPSTGRSNARAHKGGWVSYSKARRFILQTMQQKHAQDTWFTTMLDLYALPVDFPRVGDAPRKPAETRVAYLERAFGDDICRGGLWRFTPNLQLHEYEALLLAAPDALTRFYPNHASAIAALRRDIAGLAPEAVNEGLLTAPSKRIVHYIPEYQKVVAGALVAMEIGLPTLRACCSHFDAWLRRLEDVTAQG